MGLFAFAVVTFLSGTAKAGWRTSFSSGQTYANIVYGGLVQVLAGLLDFLRGEKISGSTFVAFGFFWVSHGLSIWPGLDTSHLYPTPEEYHSTMGWYLVGWTFVAFSTTMAMMRTTICQVVLLSMVTFDFFGLSLVEFYGNETWTKIVGYVLVVTGFLAWYVGTVFLLKDKIGFNLPLGHMPSSDDEDDPFHMADHIEQTQTIRANTVVNYLAASKEASEMLRERSLTPAVSGQPMRGSVGGFLPPNPGPQTLDPSNRELLSEAV